MFKNMALIIRSLGSFSMSCFLLQWRIFEMNSFVLSAFSELCWSMFSTISLHFYLPYLLWIWAWPLDSSSLPQIFCMHTTTELSFRCRSVSESCPIFTLDHKQPSYLSLPFLTSQLPCRCGCFKWQRCHGVCARAKKALLQDGIEQTSKG